MRPSTFTRVHTQRAGAGSKVKAQTQTEGGLRSEPNPAGLGLAAPLPPNAVCPQARLVLSLREAGPGGEGGAGRGPGLLGRGPLRPQVPSRTGACSFSGGEAEEPDPLPSPQRLEPYEPCPLLSPSRTHTAPLHDPLLTPGPPPRAPVPHSSAALASDDTSVPPPQEKPWASSTRSRSPTSGSRVTPAR